LSVAEHTHGAVHIHGNGDCQPQQIKLTGGTDMKVAIYTHFCTNETYGGRVKPQPSIATQLKSCRNYAKRNNLDVVAEYSEETHLIGRSKRPEYKRMMDERDSTQFQAILVYSPGVLFIEGGKKHLSRGIDQLFGEESLRKQDISLVTVHRGYKKS
jgi:DNA invertase Pin-like site-specific DNA recombinase